jgi:exodeoxyribonuclease VII large subunit
MNRLALVLAHRASLGGGARHRRDGAIAPPASAVIARLVVATASEAIQVISVADLARRLKRSVESQTGREWVEGEIVNFKAAASGHVYFSLKDQREEACLDCVMYRLDALRARKHLFDGARVQTLGRATLWAPRGRLQFVISRVRPVGLGSMLEQLERLKAKLKAEGLFERERKRPLPVAPRYVGIITSPHGAALHDIRTVAFRRGPVTLVLSPALVQGEFAPESLLKALDRIERDPRIEVVIIGRGGGASEDLMAFNDERVVRGASEDLMAFNDERVVRRVASLRVPCVSAVGHEVDTSLTDLVADRRAATPSEAAELVVPDATERSTRLAGLRRRLTRAMRARLLEDASAQKALRARLSDPRFVIAQHQQVLDEHCLRAERALRRRLASHGASLEALERRLLSRHPRLGVLGARALLDPLAARLGSVMQRRLERARVQVQPLPRRLAAAVRGRLRGEHARLGSLGSSLNALSPLTVLARGYSIALDEQGRAISRADAVAVGAHLTLRLHEGSLGARVVARSSGASGGVDAAHDTGDGEAPRQGPADHLPRGPLAEVER